MRRARFNPTVLRIRIHATVNPTEDVEKVRGAITKLFPTAVIHEKPGGFEAEAPDLDRLKELIRVDRIPDSARGAMLNKLSRDGLSTRFWLGKQAAAVGKAHFGPQRSPLGDLEVTIEGDEPHEVEKAVYAIAHDTTVEFELSRVPPDLRPQPDEPVS